MASEKKSSDVDVVVGSVVVRSKLRQVDSSDGHLPMNEVLFDRAGAPSPFGDDQLFPLPVSELTYVHPVPGAPPAHL